MMQFFGQMMKLPMAVVVYSMELFVKTMQGMRRIADQGVDVMVSGVAQTIGALPSSSSDLVSEALVTPNIGALAQYDGTTNPTSQQEESSMTDHDLMGDDLKLVRYVILFTKRDLEVTLADGTELVDYSTTLGDFQGAKRVEFLQEIAANPPQRPKKWTSEAKGDGFQYPPPEYRADSGKTFKGLPADDMKQYLKVNVQVLDRYPKDEPEYEKDQAVALKGINEGIRTILEEGIRTKQ